MHPEDTPSPSLGLKARLWLYSVNLVFGVIQLTVGSVGAGFLGGAFNGNSVAFSALSAIVGLIATVLHSILLAYSNKPTSTHLFAKVKFHSYSLTVVSVLWTAVGIMLITICPANCDMETFSDEMATVWCIMSLMGVAFTFLGACFMIISAWLLYAPTRGKEYAMDTNITTK